MKNGIAFDRGVKTGVIAKGPFRAHFPGLHVTLEYKIDVCRDIARYKRAHDIPMMQPERVIEVRERYLARGAEVNLPPDFTAALFELLIEATCKLEDELIGEPAATGERGVER